MRLEIKLYLALYLLNEHALYMVKIIHKHNRNSTVIGVIIKITIRNKSIFLFLFIDLNPVRLEIKINKSIFFLFLTLLNIYFIDYLFDSL